MLAGGKRPQGCARPACGDLLFDETSQRRRQEYRVLVEGEVGPELVLVEAVGRQVDDADEGQAVEPNKGAADPKFQRQ
ncbi:hypothetical protein [Streptomyces sp. NBC_00557]|uniref:hypothetical protein n=1 Tax=Streptomyces sp. NBC_00557 TaxID=2975776 RepID=UPI002E8239CE|nr:hypothetical protein [Streptomyces sp. NBC_00557]WUC32773.1 hypothetical protein OG956_00290 [Streptomyces sp. NBC_00557]